MAPARSTADPSATAADPSGEPAAASWLLTPPEGVPTVLTTSRELAAAVDRIAAGSGPVALDAERASSYRYTSRAYLVQLRRAGAGTALIDPIACPDLGTLDAVLAPVEWVVHAASQDLPCLAELGLRPRTLFDTELAGRLLGYPRVALGTLLETLLGVRLEKGHSAADWSARPLPDAWLSYAALDVELLLPLRDRLERELSESGKLDWAREEFAHVLDSATRAPVPRAEPWRRLSGIHRLRTRRQLAGARALWQARDELARGRDRAPGRVLPDVAIVTALVAAPVDEAALRALPIFSGPRQRQLSSRWWAALTAAALLDPEELPAATAPAAGGLPPVGRWAERDPEAAARLTRVRSALVLLAEEHCIPAENLLEPALVRRLAWDAPADIPAALAAGRARQWQRDLVGDALRTALAAE